MTIPVKQDIIGHSPYPREGIAARPTTWRVRARWILARAMASRPVHSQPRSKRGVHGLISRAQFQEHTSQLIRNFNVYGTVIRGARTSQANDQEGSEWKYVPVRRTALFMEESLYRALKWVVFEAKDARLWAEIRLNVGSFMQNLFRQGDFQGSKPTDAYFVKCDNETTTQNDINVGIVNVLVGFAPLKPAEFVIIQIQQMARQIARKEAQSHATVHRGYTALRPVQNFKFRVKWDGKYVAGVSKVGTLSSARHPRSRIRRSFFWTELDAWSRRMLLEVHQLAIRYGWSEQRF